MGPNTMILPIRYRNCFQLVDPFPSRVDAPSYIYIYIHIPNIEIFILICDISLRIGQRSELFDITIGHCRKVISDHSGIYGTTIDE